MKFLYPNEYVESVYKIDYQNLRSKGICNLIYDIDNTLAPFDVPEASKEVLEFCKARKADGFNVCLLSNNARERVELFNKSLSLPAVYKAGKPKLSGIKKALTLLKAEANKTAMIGDQIFTDIWCANRAGLYSILVKPISTRDEFTVRLKRGIEGVVVSAYVRQLDSKA